MDPETLRLIVTTSGVVLAGLGAAGITAYVNRRNVRDAHRSDRELWVLEKSHEQDESLRTKKEDLYVQFLVILDEYQSLINHAYTERQLDEDEVRRLRRKLQALMWTVYMYKDAEIVADTMAETLGGSTRFLKTVEKSINDGKKLSETEFRQAWEHLVKPKGLLIHRMQADLGHFVEGVGLGTDDTP